FRSRFIHFEIIGLNKPYRLGLCNKAISLIFKVFIFDLFFGNRKTVETKLLDKTAEILNF
ncbi:hypothetical protein ABTK04_16090, partial [Acinetobacter baumannii]